MEYLNKLFHESNMQIEPKKEKEGVCRYCGYSGVVYSKIIGFGKKQGKVYHYKLTCYNCDKSYKVKRTAFVYKKVKDKAWEFSKSYKKQRKITL